MDVERTIEYILQLQARAEERADKADARMDRALERADRADARMDRADERANKADARMDRSDARMEKFDKRLDAIRKLIQTGMKLMVKMERRQDRLDRKIDQLIASWGKQRSNGHHQVQAR